MQLRHYGSVDAYDLNNDGIKYVKTDQPSRRIYRIISHTDPWYDQDAGKKAGIQKELRKNTFHPDFQKESAYDAIYSWLNETEETIISW